MSREQCAGGEAMRVPKRFGEFWMAGWLLFCPALNAALNAHARDSRATLPVKLYGGYTVVVQGSIADIPNLNFLIDTGAMPTVVDARIARKLDLSGNRQPLTVFSRQVGTERVVLPGVRIGPAHATGVQGLVADLSFAEKSLGIRIDAIVGLDVLGHEGFSIDYRARQILFGASGAADWVAGFDPGLPQVIVELQIDARPIRLLVDTGAKYFILFARKDSEPLPHDAGAVGPMTALTPAEMPAPAQAQQKQPKTNPTIVTFGGDVRLEPVLLSHVRLGELQLIDQPAYLSPFDAGAPLGFDGVLGVAALHVQRIDFDFEHGRLGWLR
jgi:predicted aspartyl protease